VITRSVADQLLDYRGQVTDRAAEDQLLGAVAVHNILEEHGVAYLADEVGMGKTLVALGAIALFRHYDPNFRVLVVAPRENLQRKWVKEARNFVANHFTFCDLRVKSIQGTPARHLIACDNLVQWLREAIANPDRDFFLRLPSFSLPLSADPGRWGAKRDEVLELVPWLAPELLSLKGDKEVFKENFARAVCCGLPTFDLVVIDEGHNLKHGLKETAASRNRALAYVLGHPGGSASGFKGYGPRARRVLFLSATPVENDYRQLWNQCDVVNLAAVVPELIEKERSDEEKRKCVRRILIRRVTSMTVAGRRLTKNLYRREWRGGGVDRHDDPIRDPDDRQKLIVALVQKKVSELLSHEKFNNSFQIGMLASFESFLETAKVAEPEEGSEEVSPFDDARQAEDPTERQGVDVNAVNRLASSYRNAFGTELPHPKMDAVVESLSQCFETGRKALVFVRRIASVKELQHKLEDRYDDWFMERLRRDSSGSIRPALERQFEAYRRDHQLHGHQSDVWSRARGGAGTGQEGRNGEPGGRGEYETFFAWFFRGQGPQGVLSGARLQRRLGASSGALCTFFSDNHVADLLGVEPGMVRRKLTEVLGTSDELVERELRERASAVLPRVKKQQRRNLFIASQRAALSMLANKGGEIGERATIMLQERYRELKSHPPDRLRMEDPWHHLETQTFWTALRKRPSLREELWPEPATTEFRTAFREKEYRRELLSGMARLGGPLVDLYLVSVSGLETLALRGRDDDDDGGGDPTEKYLDLLERQVAARDGAWTGFRELVEAAKNFDLVLRVNAPDALDPARRMTEAATIFAQLLREQQPVGGMFGQVNQTLVRQFRMPGYPYILISTELLQEGEDLHLFCSSVYHYGISWMPSSMEQRIGRIDRVSSQTERRLSRLDRMPVGDELLQVYYPHLKETVEVLQVQRVLERMNQFLRLMHQNLIIAERESRQLDIAKEVERGLRDIVPIGEVLETAFPIQPSMLRGQSVALAVPSDFSEKIRARFARLPDRFPKSMEIKWESRDSKGSLFGNLSIGNRRQFFELSLRSEIARVFVQCRSPIQRRAIKLFPARARQDLRGPVTIEAWVNGVRDELVLGARGDVLLGDERFDADRVTWLVQRIAGTADELEDRIFGTDLTMDDSQTLIDGEHDDEDELDTPRETD
jgi:hypothetical protein